MKHVITTGAAALTLLGFGAMGIAQAETVGIAASKKGSLYDRAGTVIAKVATNQGKLPATLRNFTSPNVYIPAINQAARSISGWRTGYELSTLAVTGDWPLQGPQASEYPRGLRLCTRCGSAFFVKQGLPDTKRSRI